MMDPGQFKPNSFGRRGVRPDTVGATIEVSDIDVIPRRVLEDIASGAFFLTLEAARCAAARDEAVPAGRRRGRRRRLEDQRWNGFVDHPIRVVGCALMILDSNGLLGSVLLPPS